MPRRETGRLPGPPGLARFGSTGQSRGPLSRLPPNAILLAQLGGVTVPTPNRLPPEPTPIRGPGSRNLTLQDVRLPVFGHQGPQPDDIVQGAISTCPAAAAMMAMAHANPAAIRSMITGYQAGTPATSTAPALPRVYNIQFRRRNARVVRVTTRFYHQAGQLIYASSPNGVIWPSLLEKAYAVFAGGNSYSGLARSQRQLSNPPDISQVMQAFVGNFGWIAHTNAQNVTQPLTGLSSAQRRNLIRELNQAGNRPTIAASLGSNVPVATNVVANHGYAVLAYSGGRVTLRNPWNNASIAGGAQFRLTLNDFQSTFQMVLWGL